MFLIPKKVQPGSIAAIVYLIGIYLVLGIFMVFAPVSETIRGLVLLVGLIYSLVVLTIYMTK